MSNSIIYEYKGRKYIRIGECIRCGECCLGWVRGICPYLEFDKYGKATCLIHDVKEKDWPKDAPHTWQSMKDFPDGIGAHTNAVIRNKCGYSFMELEFILVACPTYEGKEYCFQEWIDAYNNLIYPVKDVLVVDNSKTLDFYNRWKDKINITHLNIDEKSNRRIALSMEYIRKYFLSGNYSRWFNLEADIVAPSNTIETLLSFDKNKKIDWLSHNYPARSKNYRIMSGFGCSLFSREIAKETFIDAPENTTTDGWWWNTKIKPKNKYISLEIWNLLNIKHLG